MSYAELMRQGMSSTMDELEATIESYKKTVSILEDVKRMRNKAGEFSTKQLKAQAKRKAKAEAKQATE